MSRRRRAAAVLCALGLLLVLAAAATGDVVLSVSFTAALIPVAAALACRPSPRQHAAIELRPAKPRAPPLS